MNQCCFDFIRLCAEHFTLRCPAINIGSRVVPGQEQWNLGQVPGLEHMVGLDNCPGPGVDMVGDAHHLPETVKDMETVICTSVLEHVENPWSVASEMMRVVSPTGYIIVTAPFNFPYHKFPMDYWRFSSDGLRTLFCSMPYASVDMVGPQNYYHTSVLIASHKPFEQPSLEGWKRQHRYFKPLWREVAWAIRRRLP